MGQLGERSGAVGMRREGGLGWMRASWGAPVLLRDPLTVWVVVLGVRCGWVVLGDRSNLRGETTSCSKARPSVVREVLEQQGRSVGVGASGPKEPSHVFSDHWRLGGWDTGGPVVKAGQGG